MRLTPCNREELTGYYKRTNNMKLLTEFVESGMECAKIEGFHHTRAWGCANSLNKSIERFKMGGIKAISRKGEVYLIKTSEFEK